MNRAWPAWRALVALATLLALEFPSPRPARAAPKEGAWFSLLIDPCVPVGVEAVAQQLAIELGPLRSRPRPAAGPIKLTVSCHGAETLLRAHAGASGQVLLRSVNLHFQPSEIRERILALTLAELLAASASEEERERAGSDDSPEAAPPGPAAKPAPAAPAAPVGRPPPTSKAPPAPPASQALLPPPQARVPSLRMLALAAGQVFLGGPLFLWGGGIGLGWDSPHHVGVYVDLLARHGSTSVDLGSISVDTVSLRTALLLWYGWPRVRLRTGVGLAGGLVRLHGQPADSAKAQGDTFVGGWLGPALNLGITVHLGERAALEVSTEAGYVLLPVIGQSNGVAAAAIAGPFWGLHFGVGIFP